MSISAGDNSKKGFRQILDLVFRKSPVQEKAISSFLTEVDSLYWQRAENFLKKIPNFLEKRGITIEDLVDSYLDMCHMIIYEEFKFRKTRKYSLNNANEAKAKIYFSEDKMASYVMGIALSQFLWPQHYALIDFFITQSQKLKNVSSYLEIGPGHGLYLVEALKIFSSADFLAADISSSSIRIAEEITNIYLPESRCRFIISDVNDLEVEKKDYIVMCEVMEHLDCPTEVLKRLRSFLNDDGHLFVTTCANCPVIDHVYHYRSVNHIRSEIADASLEIVYDFAFPINYKPTGEWHDEEVSSSYAALLRKSL